MKKWEVIKSEDISPSRWFPLIKQTVKLPNGKILDDYIFANLGDVSLVVPITPNKEIVFVQQYKNGIGEITLELPAGGIETGQTAEQCALDELKQETGIVSKNIEFLGTIHSMPTKLNTKFHCYISFNSEVSTEQNLDSSEEINVVVLPISTVFSMIRESKFYCAHSLAALFLAKEKFPSFFN